MFALNQLPLRSACNKPSGWDGCMQQEIAGWASEDAVESAGRNDLKWEHPRKHYCPPSSDRCQTSPDSSHHSFFELCLFLFCSSADQHLLHPGTVSSYTYRWESGSHSRKAHTAWGREIYNQIAPRQWEGCCSFSNHHVTPLLNRHMVPGRLGDVSRRMRVMESSKIGFRHSNHYHFSFLK